MVELVRHTLLDSTITDDIDNVTDLVDLKVGGERDGTLLSKVSGEEVSGTGSVTERVWHFCRMCLRSHVSCQ
jgi:hypothetical protein